jgi:hypothetical protein
VIDAPLRVVNPFLRGSKSRMVLREIDRLAKARADFAFETTLSGLTYRSERQMR